MSRLPAYPAYKDSGVPWLGQIPKHWEVKRLKNISKSNLQSLPEGTSPDYLLQYIDISNVDEIQGIGDIQEIYFEDAPSRARRIVQNSDTIISTVRTYLKAVAYFENVPSNLIVSTGFSVLHPNPDINPKFISWLVQSKPFIEKVIINSVGVSYPAIAPTRLASLPVWVPPLSEQCAIAAWLDEQTQRLDALSEKLKMLLEKLTEQRAALITRAVTRGLNPHVPLKDSGVPWLGQIPQHWEVWKIKHGFRIIGSGTTPPSDDEKWYVNGTISWVQTSELREKTIYTTEKYVTESTLSTYPTLRIYPNNSILIALYGATIGRLGILGVNACTNQACCALAISSVMDSKFVFYWLWGFKDRIVGLASGGTQPNISQDKIRNLRLALPPLPEQRAIAAWLDEQTRRLDELKLKIETALERLNEYRSALITAAVTGQIDVRNHAGPD